MSPLTLDQLKPGAQGQLVAIAGARAFRRRLMELGLTPGVAVKVHPQGGGDPMRLLIRGGTLSVRRADAAVITVRPWSP